MSGIPAGPPHPPTTIPAYLSAFRLPDAIFFSTVVSFVLVGVIFTLSCTYIARFGLARGRLEHAHQLLVAIMVLCCFAKLGLDIKRLWDAVAMTGANPFDGELTATLVMIFVPTVLAQIWLLYRVWVVSQGNLLATLAGTLVVTASIVSYTGFLVRQTTTKLLPFRIEGLRQWFLAYSITTVIADVYLSAAFITSVFLLRKRAISRRLARSFGVVLSVAVQAFLFTAFCSIGMLVCAAVNQSSPIFVAFETSLPELNTISVLYTLNSRKRTALDAQPDIDNIITAASLNSPGFMQQSDTVVAPFDTIPHSPSEATIVGPASRPKITLAEVIMEENLRDHGGYEGGSAEGQGSIAEQASNGSSTKVSQFV